MWEQARTRLAQIDDPAGSIDDLVASVAAAAEEVATAASALRALRVGAADVLAARVTDELAGLAMGGAALQVSVSPDSCDDDAADPEGWRLRCPRRCAAHRWWTVGVATSAGMAPTSSSSRWSRIRMPWHCPSRNRPRAASCRA